MLGLRVENQPTSPPFMPIPDMVARRIASDWHAGGGSPSYQFVSTGRIVEALEGELIETLKAGLKQEEMPWTNLRELSELIFYVRTWGPRPEVENWSKLTW